MRDLTASEIQAVSGGSVLEGGNGWLGFSWDESAGIIMGLAALSGGFGVLAFGTVIGLSMFLATPDVTSGGSSAGAP